MRPVALVAALVAATAVALALAGCASSVTGSPPDGPGTVTDQVPAPPADQLVFQVETAGGFVPATSFATGRPWLSVYGDGSAFVIVDRGTVSPGTPVELERASVPRGTVTKLIAAARESGLFGTDKVEFGDPGVTDMPSTRVTFRPGAAPARSVSAYALQYSEGEDNLTGRERERRRVLRNLIRAVDRDVVRDPTSSRWTPERIDVTEIDGYTRASNPLPWPGPALASVLKATERGRCGVVAGAAARTVFDTAVKNGNLHWTEGGLARPLAIRALLPGEAGCSR